MKKIGFLETWNKNSQTKEFSITRLQMVIATLFGFFFVYQYYITEDHTITVNSLVLVLILLVFAVTPKHVKDFMDIKDKL